MSKPTKKLGETFKERINLKKIYLRYERKCHHHGCSVSSIFILIIAESCEKIFYEQLDFLYQKRNRTITESHCLALGNDATKTILLHLSFNLLVEK